LLAELGATVPTPGLTLTESEFADAGPRIEDWIEQAALGLRWAFTPYPVEAS